MDCTEMNETKAITAPENPSTRGCGMAGIADVKVRDLGRKPDYLKRLGDYSGGVELPSTIADLQNHAKIPPRGSK